VFSISGRRLPSQSDTCFRCGRKKGIEAPTVQDTGTDTSMGASGRKLKTPHSAPPGPSQTSQNNDVDIINNEETPAFF